MKKQATYDPRKLEEQALKAIEKFRLTFIDEVCSQLPCSRSTFYELGLNKSDVIRDALDEMKVKVKQALKAKWFNSNNPTLEIALYRLLATPEEHRRLNNRDMIDDTPEETESFAPRIIVMDPKQIESEQKKLGS